MAAVVLYGAPYSVYFRMARLALAEKAITHRLEPVDVFAGSDLPAGYRDLQPFGKIPALRHGDFTLYETDAILRYVAEAFDGPALLPSLAGPGDLAGAHHRARMTQI